MIRRLPGATHGSGSRKGSVELPAELRERLSAWIASGYPREACGLLVGRADRGRVTVVDVMRARNLAETRARDRFELAPEDWVMTDRTARRRGLEIVGVWHSHPDHPAVPSRADRDAAWRGYAYLIARVDAAGVGELRSWMLGGDAFVEQRIDAPRAADP